MRLSCFAFVVVVGCGGGASEKTAANPPTPAPAPSPTAATATPSASASAPEAPPSRPSFKEGEIVRGRVKNITEYGVFVDVGNGIDGLLHITDMTWDRINHPSELVKQGDEITVKVLKWNPQTERLALGLKQLTPDPLKGAPKKYPAGTRAKGKVVIITEYGAWIALEPGVEGLLHVSEIKKKYAGKKMPLFHVDDAIDVVVLEWTHQGQPLLGL
jgi:ribosomal protein S1